MLSDSILRTAMRCGSTWRICSADRCVVLFMPIAFGGFSCDGVECCESSSDTVSVFTSSGLTGITGGLLHVGLMHVDGELLDLASLPERTFNGLTANGFGFA